jgi:hypothetical protein
MDVLAQALWFLKLHMLVAQTQQLRDLWSIFVEIRG